MVLSLSIEQQKLIKLACNEILSQIIARKLKLKWSPENTSLRRHGDAPPIISSTKTFTHRHEICFWLLNPTISRITLNDQT